MRNSSRFAVAAALSAAAYYLIYWRRLLIFGLVPVDGDMMRLVEPAWSIGRRLAHESLIPLWDVYRDMGCDFLAHPPNQAIYPLNRLIPASGFLDFFRLYVVLHSLLAAVPSFMLARRWKWSVPAATLAAVIVSFNGFVLARVTTTIDFAAYSWAPLAVLMLVERRAVWLGITLALQWLAGFPTFSIMTGLVLIIVAVAEDGRRSDALKFLVRSGALAAALAAIQWLPFIDLLRRSARPIFLPVSSATEFSLHPLELARPLFLPSFFVDRLGAVSGGDPAVIGFYLGPLVLTLAAIGGIRGGRGQRVLAGAALFCLLLSLGGRLPFYSDIPGITIFRFPAHWLFPATLLIGFLAAGAVDRVKSRAGRYAIVAAVAMDFLIYSWPARSVWAEPALLESKPQQLSMLGSSVPEGRVYFEPALIDASAGWVMRGPEEWERMIRIGLPSIEAGYGVHEVASRHQLTTAAHVSLVARLARASVDDPLFDHAGVSTIVRLRRPAKNVPAPEDFSIVKNEGWKPRVFFAGSGEILSLRSKSSAVTAEVKGPGRLVLSESFEPGWRADIDGRPAAVELFDGAFPSTDVPEGTHAVRFRYRPATFTLGSVVTLATIALLLLARFTRLRLKLPQRKS